MSSRKLVISSAILIAAVASLAGCGGGGGAGGPASASPSPPQPSPQPPAQSPPPSSGGGSPPGVPSVYETPEYNANYGLGSINAAAAYSAGASGQGVKVAVIDTGVELSNPELRGAIDPASGDVVNRPVRTVDAVSEHGTWVANVVAARKNDINAHGVAFNSTILAVRADAEGTCPDACSFYWSDLATATDFAVSRGARVLNYSLGGDAALSPDIQSALRSAAANQRILVFAAGNSRGADPLTPATFAGTADANGMAIAVGAVDQSNTLAWFSNKAGATRDHYLVAPGVNVATTGFGGGYVTVNGTSFAAPHVAGAAAVLVSVSPFLTSQQVVRLLLETATDLGPPGVDDVYGRGLLNLKAALSPRGTVFIPTGATVGDGGPSAAATSLRLGPAFGDALTHAAAFRRGVGFDAYQRPFTVDLTPAVRTAQARADLAAAVEIDRHRDVVLPVLPGTSLHLGFTPATTDGTLPGRVPGGVSDDGGGTMDSFRLRSTLDSISTDVSYGMGLAPMFGLSSVVGGETGGLLGRDAVRSPFLTLAGAGPAVVMEQRIGSGLALQFGATGGNIVESSPVPIMAGDAEPVAKKRAAYAAQLAFGLGPRGRATVHLGRLSENGTALDSSGRGALTLGSAITTDFMGAGAMFPLRGGYQLFGSYTMGRTHVPTREGELVRGFAGVRTEAMSLGVAKTNAFRDGDRLTLGVSRPLKVVTGSALFSVPVGRTADGQVVRKEESQSLVPSGSEFDAEISYHLDFERGDSLDFNLLTQFEPGHVSGSTPEFLIGARYRIKL